MDKNSVLSGFVGGVAATVGMMLVGRSMCARKCTKAITRLGTGDPRSSKIVKYNGTVYLAGQVGIIDQLSASDITEQTKQTLAKIDDLLAEAGTSKSRLLEARIWVLDVPQHFAKMNEVWNAWVDPENKPARFCVQSPMARPNILVEIQIVAACP